jgi:hypothetical protein
MKKASRSFGTAAVTEVFCADVVAWAMIASRIVEFRRVSAFAGNDKRGNG